jgi:hypothetical protein
LDKFRRLYPLSANFAPGEMPTAAKMTALSTQAKASSDKLEFLVGDLWNAAGDIILSPTGSITANALHIPNLARAAGKMAALNAFMPGHPSLSTSTSYVDAVGARYTGETQGYLTYVPRAAPTSGNMILSGTFSPLIQGQFQTDPADILATGDWSVDVNGKVYSYDPLPSALTFTYAPIIKPIVNSIAGAAEPGWNVIPDPSTWSGAYAGLKVSFANNTDTTNGFHIWLPPRKALTGSRLVNTSPTSVAANVQASPDAGTLLAFQSTTAAAALTNGNHYRYNLPSEITGGAANSQLPSGFLYIWDEQFGTVVDNLAYFTPANTAHSKFKVRVTGADAINVFGDTLGNGIITSDSTQLAADYISRFKIIAIGSSLAKAVSSLIIFAANHTHKLTDGGTPIPHSQLDKLVTPVGSSDYPADTLVPTFNKSRWTNDDHTQYLHRGGSTDHDPTTQRDSSDNAIYNMLLIRDLADNVTFRELKLIAANAYTQIKGFNGIFQLTNQSASNPMGIYIGAGLFPDVAITGTNVDTLSIRGGGATGVAQLVNAQFQKMFLGPDSSFNRTQSYLEWDNADKILTLAADAAPGTEVFTTSHILASEDFGALPNKYLYSTPQTCYMDLSPAGFVSSLGSNASNYFNAVWLQNNHATNGLDANMVLRFPNGAVLDGNHMFIAVGLAGGSTGDFFVKLYYSVKPVSNSFSPPPANLLCNITYTSSGVVGNLAPVGAITTHTVDNLANSYWLTVSIPHANTGNPYIYYGGTIVYTLAAIQP